MALNPQFQALNKEELPPSITALSKGIVEKIEWNPIGP